MSVSFPTSGCSADEAIRYAVAIQESAVDDWKVVLIGGSSVVMSVVSRPVRNMPIYTIVLGGEDARVRKLEPNLNHGETGLRGREWGK